MYPEDIIRVDRITFKFLWNKKWDGKCPDRIQRQVLKNNYEECHKKVKYRLDPNNSSLNTEWTQIDPLSTDNIQIAD